MTNKIAIALATVLIMAIIIPTAYALKAPTEANWYHTCENKLNDNKFQFADYSCQVDIYKMANHIETLIGLAKTSIINDELTERHIDMAKNTTDALDYRLQVLEGKVAPPHVPLTLNVSHDMIYEGEKFTIWGTADRMQQDWVDFEIHNPDGEIIQYLDLILLQSNGYYPAPIEPNNRWTTSGDYDIHAIHGGYEHAIQTIQYHLGE